MDDDGIVTNVGTDKGGNYGSNSKHYGAKPSNTVPRSKDPIIVQTLPVTQGSPLDKRNPQKLPARQGTPSKNTNPPQKLLDAAGNSLMRQQGQQSDLPARQEPALQKTNIQKPQDQGSQVPQVPRIRIKIKHSSAGYAPRRISEIKTLEKKPCENLGTVTVARNPPIIVAARDLPSGQVTKMAVPTESSVGSKVGTEKKKAQLTYMNLDETKRKLRGAYQEAENAKKKRAIQVMELCDIPKSNDIEGTQSTTSTNPISRTIPLTKSMNHISRTPSVKQKGHISRSWEHDGCK
uniref:Uncharacterized protein n=1 Tax=Setaria viridis TaxID=4556 RepID=A0A4U6U9E0_SETVI|nr:hypothetical protein SEVIR_5G035900v2 [Setaria viridis]